MNYKLSESQHETRHDLFLLYKLTVIYHWHILRKQKRICGEIVCVLASCVVRH